MQREEWRDIIGYEGLYQVSNIGRVRSLDREIHRKNRWGTISVRSEKGKIMKLKKQKNGYLVVCLSKEGKNYYCLVHRLVAAAFILNPDKKPQIDHIDGNKQNNNLTNLKWVTAAENAANPLWVEQSKIVSEETRKKMAEAHRGLKYKKRVA